MASHPSGGRFSQAQQRRRSRWPVVSGCSSGSKRESPTLLKGEIHADEIWKRFRVDSRPTYFQDQLGRIMDRIRRRPSPGWRWALRDVNLRAEPGDSIGLIGANGAGKSTLLKILT